MQNFCSGFAFFAKIVMFGKNTFVATLNKKQDEKLYYLGYFNNNINALQGTVT